MIKFFRKIRQQLLTENKFSKYVLYAIGEIILVVIGILIALQINTWNQERLASIEEEIILKNINTEFLQNKETIKASIKGSEIAMVSGTTLFNLFGKDRSEIDNHNIDSLLFNSLEPASFRPSENTISDLLQSGRLQLLKNNRLKDLIHEWSKTMKSYVNSQVRIEAKIDEEYVSYLSRNYSMKNIDRFSRLNWKNKTILKIDEFQIFQDIEFENLLDDYLYRLTTKDLNISNLDKLVDEIIEVTDSNDD